MVLVNETLSIDESEIHIDYLRASGPGGQNVNKISSAVQLRFNIRQTRSLSQEVKQRLEELAGNRMTNDGILVIDARRFRTQDQNRLDAMARLVSMVQQALPPPKLRKKTKTPRVASANRLADKARHGQQKRVRHYDPEDWE